MRVASFISLKQGNGETFENDATMKWNVKAMESENRAIVSFCNAVNNCVEGQMIILDIVQSEHPMFESLDNALEQLYSFPRFGIIFIEQLEYKIEKEISMRTLIEEILHEYFNGYAFKVDSALTNTFNLYENNEDGITFNYLNEKYVFIKNPSHTM